MGRYKEIAFKELLSEDGYVVCIEGDEDLYDDEIGKWLHENVKNYKLINKIYSSPEKLYGLKDIKIDVFIFQTTGLNPKLSDLIDLYIEKIGNYPKHFVSVFRDGEDFFWKILNQMDSYEVWHVGEIVDNKLYVIRQDHTCKDGGIRS